MDGLISAISKQNFVKTKSFMIYTFVYPNFASKSWLRNESEQLQDTNRSLINHYYSNIPTKWPIHPQRRA